MSLHAGANMLRISEVVQCLSAQPENLTNWEGSISHDAKLATALASQVIE